MSQGRHPIVEQDVRSVVERAAASLDRLEGRSLVITGATGLLATYLVETIAWANDNRWTRPCRLTGIVRTPPPADGRHGHLLDAPGIRFVTHDARSVPADLDDADYLVLAATKGAPRHYLREPTATLELNGAGLGRWLDLAARTSARGVLYVSSGEVYGPNPPTVPTPEDCAGAIDPTLPRSVYAEAKRYGESLALAWWREHGVPVKIVRPFQVFGPGIRDDDGRALPDFVIAAARGEPCRLSSAGLARRTFLYIADATVAFWKVLLDAEPGSVYNVGADGDEVSIRELAERAVRNAGTGATVEIAASTDASGVGSPVRSRPDTSRIRRDLGFEPTHDLDGLLTRTLDWLQTTLPDAAPVRRHQQCRGCGDPLPEPMIAFDRLPVAGAYVDDPDATGGRYPLTLHQCPRCSLLQLGQSLTPSFYRRYRFASAAATAYRAHFEAVADRVAAALPTGSSVLEIGCSDGSLLAMLAARGLNVGGFEPAEGPAAAARARGLRVHDAPFDPTTAEHSPIAAPDLVIVRHVLEHLDDFAAFFSALRTLCGPGALLLVEVPDLQSTLAAGITSNVYHPHTCYFDRDTLAALLRRHGWSPTSARVVPVFGGSLLAAAALDASRMTSATALVFGDDSAPVDPAALTAFVDDWRARNRSLHDFFAELVDRGLVVAGYGAAERTAATLGAAELQRSHVRWLYDRNPALHGLSPAGCGIPIKPPEDLLTDQPDVLAIFAQSNETEIVAGLTEYTRRGGRLVSLRSHPPRFLDNR